MISGYIGFVSCDERVAVSAGLSRGTNIRFPLIRLDRPPSTGAPALSSIGSPTHTHTHISNSTLFHCDFSRAATLKRNSKPQRKEGIERTSRQQHSQLSRCRNKFTRSRNFLSYAIDQMPRVFISPSPLSFLGSFGSCLLTCDLLCTAARIKVRSHKWLFNPSLSISTE